MPFTKHTQSEDHEVVSDQEKDVIQDHTRKTGSVSHLNDAERERLLKELEHARSAK